MQIEGTRFGRITIGGKTYKHDVIICQSGAVKKRRKKLSKKLYGTSHMISKPEAKFVLEKGCRLLIVGTGQEGNVKLSPEAKGYFEKKRCAVLLLPTPEAVRAFNRARGRTVGLMHVTC